MSTAIKPARPPVRANIRRAAITAIVVALACGLAGGVVGEEVVSAIGGATDHEELALRALGWCWSGLPFTLTIVATFLRARLAPRVKPYVAMLLAAWAASGTLFIPARGSTPEGRFGAAYPDARFLSYAWAAGFLSIFALLVVGSAAILIVSKAKPQMGKPQKGRLIGWVFNLLAALFVTAAWSLPWSAHCPNPGDVPRPGSA
ncbi:hypothetical protein [Kribbella sp. DT2]|uniref:hypothetical protein n=1 Tax=Kribbella sp. DT2 TaxID=3393427 RepID=UPI003CE91204